MLGKLLYACFISCAYAKARVFLMAGQSNMLGQGISAELTPPYNTAQTDVAYWKNIRWVDLAPGFGRGTDFGPEFTFGRAVKDALPSDTIHLVKYAVSGTNLYKQWKPGANIPLITMQGGPQYTTFMTTANAALDKLKRDGIEYELSGMLWMQGEADAIANKEGEYEANLRAFIADMRITFK